METNCCLIELTELELTEQNGGYMPTTYSPAEIGFAIGWYLGTHWSDVVAGYKAARA